MATGNEGVAQRGKITQVWIGYVESGFASRLRLPLAWLENRSGRADRSDRRHRQARPGRWLGCHARGSDRHCARPRGARSYPIVTFTWALARAEYPLPFDTGAVHDFPRWVLTEAWDQAESLGFVPLPETLARASLLELDGAGGIER